jgi:hypothetical protein
LTVVWRKDRKCLAVAEENRRIGATARVRCCHENEKMGPIRQESVDRGLVLLSSRFLLASLASALLVQADSDSGCPLTRSLQARVVEMR